MKKGIDSRQILLLILLLVVAVIPVSVRIPYPLSIRVMAPYMVGASLAWSILGGLTDQISPGHVSFTGLGAYMLALLLVKQNVSPWINIPLVFLSVGVLTALLLPPCFVLGGPYFSLVTTAFGEVFHSLMTSWDSAGKRQGLPLPFGGNFLALLRFKSKVSYFYLSLPMAIAVYLIVRAIDRSKLGYVLKMVGEDKDTANAVGINLLKYKMLTIFVSCELIAICGVLYTNYIRFISPDIMIQTRSMEFVLPTVTRGTGSVTGLLIGAIVLTPLAQCLNSTLSSIAPGASLLVYAIVLVVVILPRPRGIMGWYNGSKFKVKTDEVFDRLDGKK